MTDNTRPRGQPSWTSIAWGRGRGRKFWPRGLSIPAVSNTNKSRPASFSSEIWETTTSVPLVLIVVQGFTGRRRIDLVIWPALTCTVRCEELPSSTTVSTSSAPNTAPLRCFRHSTVAGWTELPYPNSTTRTIYRFTAEMSCTYCG